MVASTTLPMLKYVIIFLIAAIIAAVFGFVVLAGRAALIAKGSFVVLILLLTGSLLYDPARRHSEL